MGNSSSTVINQKINASKVVTEAYLAITQDIAQGVYSNQKIEILCNKPKGREMCNGCILQLKSYGFNPYDIERLCSSLCNCKMENVNLGQIISFNSSIFTKASVKQEFETQILNNIAQQSKQQEGGLFIDGDTISNTVKTIDKLFTGMNSSSFQSAVNSMSTIQQVRLSGAGTIINVDMNIATDYISTILETNKETSSSIQELQNNILQLSTQVASAGLTQLIMWIVRIVTLLFIIIVLLYVVNLVFQIYSLYV